MSFRDRISRNSKPNSLQHHQVIDDEIAVPPPPPPMPVAPSDLFRFLNDPLLKKAPVSRRVLSYDQDSFEAAFGEEINGDESASNTSANMSFAESGGAGKTHTFKREGNNLLRDAVLLQATVVEYHGELLYPDGTTSNERLLQHHKEQQEAAAALVAAGQAAAQAVAAAAALQASVAANRNSRSMYRSSTSGGADGPGSPTANNTQNGRSAAATEVQVSSPNAQSVMVKDSTSLGAQPVDPPKPSVYHHVQRSHIMNRDALFHGKGTLVSTLGYTYSGEFDRGLMSGKGKIDWSDGTSYEGDFLHSVIVGSGKYVWASGDTYEGEVKDAVRNGHGTFVLKLSGERYEGEWVRGMRHGKGLLRYSPLSSDIYASRCQYDGEWRNDQKCGLGTMVYASGDVYEGEWKSDRRNGWGSMVWKRRGQPVEVYTGEWVDGTQEGYGESVYIRPSANFVLPVARPSKSGDISSEAPTMLFASATVAQALRDSAMNIYKGEFLGGERNGFGVMQYDDGSRFEGFWRDNHKHGEGKLITSTGVVFVGAFDSGNPVDASVEGGPAADPTGTSVEGELSPKSKAKKSLSEVAADIPFNASHTIGSAAAVSGNNNAMNTSMSTTATAPATTTTTTATLNSGLRTVASPLPLHIHDILGVGVSDPGEAVAEVQNVISRHSGVLKRVFFYYSNLEHNVELVTTPGGGWERAGSNSPITPSPLAAALPLWRRSRTPGTMHIIQFVRMLNDCRVLNRHISLAVVGRILCAFRDLHQSTTPEAFGNIGLPSPPLTHQQQMASSQQPPAPAGETEQQSGLDPQETQSPSTPRGSASTVATRRANSTATDRTTTSTGPTVTKPSTGKPATTTTRKTSEMTSSSQKAGGTTPRRTNEAPLKTPIATPNSTTLPAANKKPFSIMIEPSAPKVAQPQQVCPSTMRRASLQIPSDGSSLTGAAATSIQEFLTKKSGVNVAAIKRRTGGQTLPNSRSPQTAPLAGTAGGGSSTLIGQYQVPWREYRANLHSLRNGELTYRDFVEALVRVAALLYSGTSGCTPGSFDIYGSVSRRFAVLVEEHISPHACLPSTTRPLCSLTRENKEVVRTLSGNKNGSSRQPNALSIANGGGKRVNIQGSPDGPNLPEVELMDALTEIFMQFSNGTFLGSTEGTLHGSTLVTAHPYRKVNQHFQVTAVNALKSGTGIGVVSDGRCSELGSARRSEPTSPASSVVGGGASPEASPHTFSNTSISVGFSVHPTAGTTMTVRQFMIFIKTLNTFALSHGASPLFPPNVTLTSLLKKISGGTGIIGKFDRFPQLTAEIARKQHLTAAQVKRLEMPAATNAQAINELAQSISAKTASRANAPTARGPTSSDQVVSTPAGADISVNGLIPLNASLQSGTSTTSAGMSPTRGVATTSTASMSPPAPTLAQVETEESAQAKAEALYLARRSLAHQSKGTSGANELSTVVMDTELTFVEFVEAVLSLAHVVANPKPKMYVSNAASFDGDEESKQIPPERIVEHFARKVLFPFYFNEVCSSTAPTL